MPATAIREPANAISHDQTGQLEESATPKNTTRNRFSKRPTPDMLSNTYTDPETGEIDPKYGREFVLEQMDRWFISTLSLPKREFIALCEEAYEWHQNASKREKQMTILELLDNVDGDTEALQMLQNELKQRLDTVKSTKNGR